MASNNEGNSITNSTMLMFENAHETDEHDLKFDKEVKTKNEQAHVAGILVNISELLSSGILVNAVEYDKLLYYASKNCMTPLKLAAVNGHEDCLDILIKHGADVNAKDRFNVTALHMAAEKGYFSCVKKLLDAGADCRIPTIYPRCVYCTTVPYIRGITPLHLAAANNHIDCCEVLIHFRADSNAIDEDGRTSLFIATRASFGACVLTLLRHAVGRNILSMPDFRTMNTPLHFAVLHQMLDCIRELLKLGADVNHINKLGYSPLHTALMPLKSGISRYNALSKMLIIEGFNTDINLPDARRYMPLHYVCFDSAVNRWLRRPQLATFLIKYGANINIRNTSGTTLLQWELTSRETNYDVLKYMVRSMLHLPRLEDVNRHSANEPYPQSNFRYMSPADPAPLNLNQRTNQPYFRPIDLNFGNTYLPNLPAIGQFIPFHNDYYVQTYQINWNSRVAEKRLWYERMASSARTLQHCCRFAIRKAMGCRRLKHVRKLPIPPKLHSYILLESD